MGDIPDFVTHYHLPDRPPFLNLGELDSNELTDVLAGLNRTANLGRSRRRFGRRYMQLRHATERRLRERFIERGGRPVRQSPHYFVLGESPWFAGLYDDVAEVRIPIEQLPHDQTSFTCPDSVTSMGLLSSFGIEQPVRAHHGHVYLLDEMTDVISRVGLPQSAKPDNYDGHQYEDFEHYIEVQIWADEVTDLANG